MLLNSNSAAGRTAGGGLLTALILVFIILSSISPTANLAFFALTSLCVAVAVVRYGFKTALFTVMAAGLLAAVWPGLFFALPFVFFFGPWPLVKAWIENKCLQQKASEDKLYTHQGKMIPHSYNILTVIIKQSAATMLLVSAGFVYISMFSIDLKEVLQFGLLADLPDYLIWIIIIVTAELAIFVFDWALTLLITWYMRRLHGRI